MTADPGDGPRTDLDQSIARLLTIGTYGSVALLAVGVVIMFGYRIDPLAGGPPLQPNLVIDDVLHLRPAGFMWLGLLAVIATPASRVAVALVGYARRGERVMAVIAALILVVIGLSVTLAQALDA